MEEDSARCRGFDWRSADYYRWNERLVDYFLGSRGGDVVDRVPANPEELLAIVGEADVDSMEVAAAFVDAVRAQLPRGVSFCGFCQRNRGWTIDSEDAPAFFGMLWFTCLLASGHADHYGSFFHRFKGLIGTGDHLRCLDELWEELAAWSRRNSRCAELALPPADDHLVVIGRSYYLAFPNRRDRRVLQEALGESDLIGFEPPILPVVRAVQKHRQQFTSDFRDVLDDFTDRFLHASRDPTESPFWRAIRTVALHSRQRTYDGAPAGRATLLATWDDDETLLVRVACVDRFTLPGSTSLRLPVPLEDVTHYLVDEHEDVDAVASAALSLALDLPRGLTALVRQGVLVFLEDLAGEYRLVTGESVNGADLALVRDDRVDSLLAAFGGEVEDSRYPGWREIVGCRLHQVAELPSGLENVTQLLHTTSAPRPRLVGGVRVAGGYIWIPGFEPLIRAPGARAVECDLGGGGIPCEPVTEGGDWRLPTGLPVSPPTKVEVSAQFDVRLEEATFSREGTTTVRFVSGGHGSQYKAVGAGRYWRETCPREQAEHRGHAPVPLDISTSDQTQTADFLQLDPSTRYLGPGLGEFSRVPRTDHQWLVVGPRKNPRDLVFIGDLDAPVAPDGGESPAAGDRRTWSRSFSAARITALVGGSYVPLRDESRLLTVFRLYRQRARRTLKVGQGRVCAPSGVDAWLDDGPAGTRPRGRTQAVAEAVAALGVSRAGFPLRELQALVDRLTEKEEPLLRQHVIRAWTEAGSIDLLRRQDRSQTLVVPRPPLFVMMQKGPTVDATLVGLAPLALVSAIEGLLPASSVRYLPPTSPFQPSVQRLENVEPERVAELSSRVGLAPPEWLWWPDSTTTPEQLLIRDDLAGVKHGAPSEGYRFDARWDWAEMMFRRSPRQGSPELVEVERRRHPQRCSIYTVLLDGEAMFWCHPRSWALLRAAELREKPPFSLSDRCALTSTGTSPMHLPLPLGRLCAVMGAALPGPILDRQAQVSGYQYPFGERVRTLVERVLPRAWLEEVP